ncbi:MAG: hypothetical protein EAZ11_12630 [Curvibacter sp.]|nr:MAG: hypothetical protein EAZ11_12630 [Curvibacter sp.]
MQSADFNLHAEDTFLLFILQGSPIGFDGDASSDIHSGAVPSALLIFVSRASIAMHAIAC